MIPQAVDPPFDSVDIRASRKVLPRGTICFHMKSFSVTEAFPVFADAIGRLTRRQWPAPPDDAAGRAVQSSPGLDAILEYAGSRICETLPDRVQALVSSFTDSFDARAGAASPTSLFVYHVDLPAGLEVRYRDVRLDLERVDYLAVLDHFIECKRRHLPGAVLYLVTSLNSRFSGLADEDVRIVPLAVDPAQPMYSRAVAMYAYALSRAFNGDTAFLDSDAFPNAPFEDIFRLDFDVGLTYRLTSDLMPINEGAIFARRRRREAVQRFFQTVLATYEVLVDDPRILSYYGDIRTWRGGQLALNAIVRSLMPLSPYRRYLLGESIVRFLPCDTFNFSYDYKENAEEVSFSGKYVVHLKGSRKDALEVLRRNFSRGNAHSSPSPAPGRDRRYSLDSTPPEDYEPGFDLDYRRATLTQIADHFKTDKGTIKHGYTEIYARYFEEYRDKAVELLEIGVACGSSLKAWARYLGPKAHITGVDIRPECLEVCGSYDRISIVIADVTNWDANSEFDIVIDDGSHVSVDIVKAFDRLWPRVKRGGYYAVEDLRCTHDAGYMRNFPTRKAVDDFKRTHFINWLDGLLRRMDYRSADMEYVHIYSELLIIKKI